MVRQWGDRAWTGILWSGLDEQTADAAIQAQIEFFAGPFEWKHYGHDGPADLGDRLRRAGLRPDAGEALMMATVADLATDARLPDGVEVRRVVDGAGLDMMAEVHERAFGADGARLRDRLANQMATAPDSIDLMVAVAGDVPVCAARMDFHPGTDFAGLWGGGTVPEWRGRGIYRALVALRARIAAERGFRYLQVDASDDSRPILKRLGFVQVDTTTPYRYETRR